MRKPQYRQATEPQSPVPQLRGGTETEAPSLPGTEAPTLSVVGAIADTSEGAMLAYYRGTVLCAQTLFALIVCTLG